MTKERYHQLMDEPDDTKAKLTQEEMADGWHWCWEFDGLLRQPIDEGDPTYPNHEYYYCCPCLRDANWLREPERWNFVRNTPPNS